MFERQINSGVAYLDQLLPGWEKYIDLKFLDMESGRRCIIGQLENVNGYLIHSYSYGNFHDPELGFDLSPKYFKTDTFPDKYFNILREEWVEVIKNKLKTNDINIAVKL